MKRNTGLKWVNIKRKIEDDPYEYFTIFMQESQTNIKNVCRFFLWQKYYSPNR